MLKLPFVDEHFIRGPDKTTMIKEFINENKGVFEGQLIGDLSHINHRAENYNGVQIENVEHQSENGYCMDYTYDWFVYNGCADMDEEGIEDGFVCFTIGKDGELEFEIPQLEERTTHNEF